MNDELTTIADHIGMKTITLPLRQDTVPLSASLEDPLADIVMTASGILAQAQAAFAQNRLDVAEDKVLRALSMRNTGALSENKRVIALGLLASISEKIGQVSNAEFLLTEAIHSLQQLPPSPRRLADEVALHNQLAALFTSQKKCRQAEAAYWNAIQLCQQRDPETSTPTQALIYHNISHLYWTECDYESAFETEKIAIQLSRRTLPLHSPQLASSYRAAGLFAFLAGKAHEAITHLLDAQTALRHGQIPSVEEDTELLTNLGAAYLAINNPGKAEACFIEAVNRLLEAGAAHNTNLAELYFDLGYTYATAGMKDDALRFYRMNLEVLGTIPNVSPQRLAETHQVMAELQTLPVEPLPKPQATRLLSGRT
jgi:tetratricopeptide (TPR) repeat protein